MKKYHQDRVALAKWRKENPKAKYKPLTLPKSIIDLGRLAEPALVRVHHLAKDTTLRYVAKDLLRQLQSYRNALAVAAAAK